MANSIYDYIGFYSGAKNLAKSTNTKTYTSKEMNKIIYNNDSVFWSSANRGKASSTNLANGELVVNKKLVSSTVYEQALSRFYNIENLKLNKGKVYQNNTIGTSNIKNANQSDFNKVDAEWISSRFMTANKDLSRMDRNNRFFSTTGWKFDSTRLGHNTAINARSQFTRTCDIRGNNRVSNNGLGLYGGDDATSGYGLRLLDESDKYGLGMGRYYSESIDDNATQIFMQFGVPKFNSLIDFFINAVSYEDSYIANYGRIPTSYSLGSTIGKIIIWCAFPLMTTTIWILKGALSFFLGHPFNYYYMEPTMHTYWTSVNLIVNQIAAELGLIAPVLIDDETTIGKDKEIGEEQKNKMMGVPVRISSSDLEMLSKYLPEAVSKDTGYIDIYHIANKGQILANQLSKIEYNTYNNLDKENGNVKKEIAGWYNHNNTNTDVYYGKTETSRLGKIQKILDQSLYLSDWIRKLLKPDNSDLKSISESSGVPIGEMKINTEKDSKFSFRNKTDLTKIHKQVNDEIQKSNENNNDKQEQKIGETSIDRSSTTNNILGTMGNVWSDLTDWLGNGAETFDAAVRDGGAYAIFNVDFQGSVSESISNQVSDIQSAGVTKSVAQAARDFRFSLGGGLTSTGLGQIVDTLKNFAIGTVNEFSYGLANVVSSLLGGGYADIPKKWDDSDFSFPSVNYSMTLVSPYGNPISQLQNIYIPLAMILAGSLPLQAGKSSYTSPFLCSIFNKGVQDVRLGMITNVSITRGITNLPFSRTKRMLSCEVNFTITDLSTRLVAPINSSPWKTLFSLNWDDDTPTGIYLATLASRDLFTNKYQTARVKRKIAKMAMAFSQSLSPSNYGYNAGQPGGVMNKLFGLFAADRRFSHNQRNF